MGLINNEENHFFGVYDNDKYYVNKTTSKKPGSSKSSSKGTSKSTSKPSSSSSSKSSSKSNSGSKSSSGSGGKSTSGSFSNSSSRSSSGSSSGYRPSSGATPTAIKNADNRATGYKPASSGYKPSTSSSSKGNNITGTTTRNNFLGGYTGSHVRSNAGGTTVKRNTSPTFNATANVNTNIAGLEYLQKNNVSYLEYTRRNGTTVNGQFIPKIFVQDYDLGVDAASRGKTISNGSSGRTKYTKIDTPKSGGFLGGYSGAQVRKDINSSTKNNYVNDGTYRDLSPSAINNRDRQTIANGTMKGTSGISPTAINSADKVKINSKEHPYGQIKRPSGGGFLGGYTGRDVLKDAGVTPKKSRGSIFTKIGNFFKDPIGTITKKNNDQNTPTNVSSNDNGGITSKKLTSEVDKGTLDRLNVENVSTKPFDPFKSITGRDSLTNFTEADVERLAALMFREAGGSFVHGSDEEWFAFLNSGAVALNNAYDKGVGNTFSDRLTSLSNNVYQGLSSYATSDFDTVTSGASEAEKEDLKNAARLVLSGQYTLPSNMHLQASESIVNNNGTSWNSHGVDYDYGYGDIHIGYDTGSAPESTPEYKDIYTPGKNIS